MDKKLVSFALRALMGWDICPLQPDDVNLLVWRTTSTVRLAWIRPHDLWETRMEQQQWWHAIRISQRDGAGREFNHTNMYSF